MSDIDERTSFRWSPELSARPMAESGIAMPRVYGFNRGDAEHFLNSFTVLRKCDERDYGEFRTKRLVIAEYDAMATAAATGVPYRSPLDPPPGSGPRHPPRPA